MRLSEVIRRRLRASARSVDVQGDVNAVVAANVNEPGSVTSTSSRQRVVQRDGRTVVSETTTKEERG